MVGAGVIGLPHLNDGIGDGLAVTRAFVDMARGLDVVQVDTLGATLHQVNESTPVAELRALTALYRCVLEELLG